MAKERNIITRATFDIAARDRARGALLGLAAGDAVGTRVEFHPPGAFMPLTDVVGGGPFGPEPGQWTDDRSMALCLAESMIDCGGHDSADQMRCCGRWWKQGTFSPTGRCFDIDGPAGDQESPPAGTGDGFSGGGHPPDREAAGRRAQARSIHVLVPLLASTVQPARHAARVVREQAFPFVRGFSVELVPVATERNEVNEH